MSVETNPHNYTNMNNTFSQILMSAPNSPQTKRGANGKFLPKPLLFHLRLPNSKKISRVFCEILSPKNSFRKTESALVPPLARILGGQNTKEKMSFPFSEKIGRAQIRKARNIFSLVLPSEARQWRDGSFTLEIGSSKVYNYSTSSNLNLHKLHCSLDWRHVSILNVICAQERT